MLTHNAQTYYVRDEEIEKRNWHDINDFRSLNDNRLPSSQSLVPTVVASFCNSESLKLLLLIFHMKAPSYISCFHGSAIIILAFMRASVSSLLLRQIKQSKDGSRKQYARHFHRCSPLYSTTASCNHVHERKKQELMDATTLSLAPMVSTAPRRWPLLRCRYGALTDFVHF